ncbi:MAG: hypothetical protein K2X81_06720, partial [Candidatus Obscuribacterales bacterium]|nr:hypothetical protein [Candidatus Obscuribacterales bacterium]
HVKNGVSARLEKMLSNSLLVWEWDEKEMVVVVDTYFCRDCAPTSEDPRNGGLVELAAPLIWPCTTCKLNSALYRLDKQFDLATQ